MSLIDRFFLDRANWCNTIIATSKTVSNTMIHRTNKASATNKISISTITSRTKTPIILVKLKIKFDS